MKKQTREIQKLYHVLCAMAEDDGTAGDRKSEALKLLAANQKLIEADLNKASDVDPRNRVSYERMKKLIADGHSGPAWIVAGWIAEGFQIPPVNSLTDPVRTKLFHAISILGWYIEDCAAGSKGRERARNAFNALRKAIDTLEVSGGGGASDMALGSMLHALEILQVTPDHRPQDKSHLDSLQFAREMMMSYQNLREYRLDSGKYLTKPDAAARIGITTRQLNRAIENATIRQQSDGTIETADVERYRQDHANPRNKRTDGRNPARKRADANNRKFLKSLRV